MIDDFVWKMGFLNAEAASKVTAKLVVIMKRVRIHDVNFTGTTGHGHFGP